MNNPRIYIYIYIYINLLFKRGCTYFRRARSTSGRGFTSGRGSVSSWRGCTHFRGAFDSTSSRGFASGSVSVSQPRIYVSARDSAFDSGALRSNEFSTRTSISLPLSNFVIKILNYRVSYICNSFP